jgi:ATP-dependent helicase/nuclease subunit B
MSSASLQHSIALVRPGPTSLAWLQTAVRELKGTDPLQPLTVVAPSPYLMAVVRQRLAESGCANVSLRVQLRPLAERIARACGSKAFECPLTGPLEAAAIRVAISEASEPLLQPLATNAALQESLGALFRDLGHLDQLEPARAGLAQDSSVGAAARRTYNAYRGLTRDFPDVPRQLRIAAELVRNAPPRSPWAEELGPVVLYLSPRLDAAEREFLRSLAGHVPVVVSLPWLDDPVADAPTRETADALAAALNTSVTACETTSTWPSMRVLSAPDPEEEARSVLRRMLADMEAGEPLWRMAVLYSADEPYAALLRETLDSADVPWHSALGRPASAGLAARSLLGLLALRERAFAREAVLDWLASRPTLPDSDGAGDPLPDVPISVWDRLSRRAQVLQGAEQWIGRVERLIKTLEAEDEARWDWRAVVNGHEAQEQDVPRPPDDVEHARAIATAIGMLDRDTRPPAGPQTWDGLVHWASSLRDAYVRDDPSWPPFERAAAEALDDALDSLRDASALEPTTTVGAFREALAAALEARRLPEGPAGAGVLVAPVGASTGACFDRVYVLGMTEGALPSRPAVDPLTGGTGDTADPLGRRDRQRSDERRAFLSALAGVGEGGSIVLSYARTDGAARASYPSRWLLEQVARIEGVPFVFASDLGKLYGPGRAWLERIDSAYNGLSGCATALNIGDLRLREVVVTHSAGHHVSETQLARRSDLVLGRALHAAHARQSREFSEFDGNLATVAAASSRIAYPFSGGSSASSATSLERWSTCPYQYFLTKVLRVEATERPEEEWTLNPLEKGTLVHAALETFFRERLAQGRSRPDEPFTVGDHTRLDEIVSELLADLEAQGRTGHAIAWENARAALVADLHLEIDREETWRTEEGLVPALFERTFGDERDPDTWPAVEVPLAAGSVVRFRGAIDRVDISPSRVLVIDYKSGSTWGFDGLEDDPVLAGRHLQLVLYARATRGNVADVDDVRAEFRFVSTKGKFERRQIVANADADQRLAEVVQHVADGIRSGVFLPRPGEYDRGTFKNCRFCEYDRICSTSRDLAWERKSPGIASLPLEPGS